MSYGTVQAEKMTTESGYSLGAGDASAFKNRIINGNMRIDQRNNGSAVTKNSAGWTYTLDRWGCYGVGSAGVFTVQQQTSTPPTGFTHYLRSTVTTADSSLTAGEFYLLGQFVEGNNIADLAWGSANAKPVMISFWARSSLTGTFGGVINNSSDNYGFPFTYTINAANTWEYKTVSVSGPTSGTFLTTTSTGFYIFFGLGVNAANSGTAGSWTSSASIYGATGATNVMATNGATLDLTGIQIEVGTVATSFETRSYGTELGLCQRYFIRFGGIASYTPFGVGLWRNTTTPNIIMPLPVQMRTSPTCTFSSASNFFVSNGASNVTPSALALDQSSPLSLMIDATYSSGTSGQATRIFAANTTAATIDASAELS